MTINARWDYDIVWQRIRRKGRKADKCQTVLDSPSHDCWGMLQPVGQSIATARECFAAIIVIAKLPSLSWQVPGTILTMWPFEKCAKYPAPLFTDEWHHQFWQQQPITWRWLWGWLFIEENISVQTLSLYLAFCSSIKQTFSLVLAFSILPPLLFACSKSRDIPSSQPHTQMPRVLWKGIPK